MDPSKLIEKIEKYLGRDFRFSILEFNDLKALRENVWRVELILSHPPDKERVLIDHYKKRIKKLEHYSERIEKRLNIWIQRLERLIIQQEKDLTNPDKQHFESWKERIEVCKNNLIRILAKDGELHDLTEQDEINWKAVDAKIKEAFGDINNPGISMLMALFKELEKVEKRLKESPNVRNLKRLKFRTKIALEEALEAQKIVEKDYQKYNELMGDGAHRLFLDAPAEKKREAYQDLEKKRKDLVKRNNEFYQRILKMVGNDIIVKELNSLDWSSYDPHNNLRKELYEVLDKYQLDIKSLFSPVNPSILRKLLESFAKNKLKIQILKKKKDKLISFRSSIEDLEKYSKEIMQGCLEILKMIKKQKVHLPIIFIARAMSPLYYGTKILDKTLGWNITKNRLYIMDRFAKGPAFDNYILSLSKILKNGVITVDYGASGHQAIRDKIKQMLKIKDFVPGIGLTEMNSLVDSHDRKVGLTRDEAVRIIGKAISTCERIPRKFDKEGWTEGEKGDFKRVTKKLINILVVEGYKSGENQIYRSGDLFRSIPDHYTATLFLEMLQREAFKLK